MKGIHVFIIAQILLIALVVHVIADDMQHPERWDTFYRNPAFSIPWCLGIEVFIVLAFLRQWRKQQRFAEGLRLLEKADRLWDQGLDEESDAAYREGCRLCGLKRR